MKHWRPTLRRCHHRLAGDDGSVTAEVALGMMGLMLVVTLVFQGFAIASAHAAACADARDVLRAVTRGAPPPSVSSTLTIDTAHPWTTVRAARHVPGASLIGLEAVTCEVSGMHEGGTP